MLSDIGLACASGRFDESEALLMDRPRSLIDQFRLKRLRRASSPGINDVLQPPRIWRKKTRATLHKMGLKNRLTRADIYYLYGVRGMAAQYEASQHMQALRVAAEELMKAKSHTVIGFGAKPSLPNGLTLRQAEALAELGPRRTNSEIAAKLETTEAAIKKRLQEAYRKLGVADRAEAERWVKKNL
ncbi:helix-turn-helix transcriptional regulator [Gemmobacter denitrificans]|uniref:LuxR C-terminal-related transcriptional regulator n=1 Tax=Gemmobacter denitrificans TaxID=3123040 RepID=A0ABU8C0L0_9RHOB